MSVCLSVCLFFSALPSQKPQGRNLTKLRVNTDSRYGSVFLWRRRDMLCTSGFVDDIMFSHNGTHRAACVFPGVKQNKCCYSIIFMQHQLSSIAFVINRFFMNLFSTSDMKIISGCQDYFSFELRSVTLARRTDKFLDKLKLCENYVIKMFCVCNNTN